MCPNCNLAVSIPDDVAREWKLPERCLISRASIFNYHRWCDKEGILPRGYFAKLEEAVEHSLEVHVNCQNMHEFEIVGEGNEVVHVSNGLRYRVGVWVKCSNAGAAPWENKKLY